MDFYIDCVTGATLKIEETLINEVIRIAKDNGDEYSRDDAIRLIKKTGNCYYTMLEKLTGN